MRPKRMAAARRLQSIIGTKRRARVDAPLDFAAMTVDLREFIGVWCAQNCAGWALAFCQSEAVAEWRAAFEAGGAKWRRAMVWVKPDSSPQLSGDRPAVGYESIAAAWCGAGGSTWNGGGRRGVFVIGKHDQGAGHGGRKNEHPTQKPIELMSQLVSLFSNAGDVVADPFMGSGSTGVAAARLGRRFVGVEQDAKYFDIACRRVAEAMQQTDMFIAPPAPAEQLALGASDAL